MIDIYLIEHFRRAKLLLRKKKFQEGLIQKTENQLETIERMVSLLSITS